ENAIRPTAVGKKNFPFIGHSDAGDRSAILYSILGSCRSRSINPEIYLKDKSLAPLGPGARSTAGRIGSALVVYLCACEAASSISNTW
ncbi:MAG: hypothetical protein KIT22_04785, partial [Verrucomicrobiae bacterium]|nr:hypothetical protein [Verrucomicrobiae bacterium]